MNDKIFVAKVRIAAPFGGGLDDSLLECAC